VNSVPAGCGRLRGAIPHSFRIVERPGELLIGVRWLRPAAAAVMLVSLTLFWSVGFYTQGPTAGLISVLLITSYPGLLMAFNSSWVSVKQGLVKTRPGPIPIVGGRHRLNPAEIVAIYSTKVCGAAGRGGVSERYTLMATMRSGIRPVPILESFEREEDAAMAARLLIRRLNELRPQGALQAAFLDS
jgi:hypothetical protein